MEKYCRDQKGKRVEIGQFELENKNQQLEQSCLERQAALNALQEANEQQAHDLLREQSKLTDLKEESQTLRESLAKEVGRREVLERAVKDRDVQIAVLQNELKVASSRNETLGEALAIKTAELQQAQNAISECIQRRRRTKLSA